MAHKPTKIQREIIEVLVCELHATCKEVGDFYASDMNEFTETEILTIYASALSAMLIEVVQSSDVVTRTSFIQRMDDQWSEVSAIKRQSAH